MGKRISNKGRGLDGLQVSQVVTDRGLEQLRIGFVNEGGVKIWRMYRDNGEEVKFHENSETDQKFSSGLRL